MMKKNLQKILSHKSSRPNRGFTLVETLVAISILMLAVTGPLYFASESLKAATYARDQITAFYLAQDAFEQIRKIRDDNRVISGKNWNDGLTNCESVSCRVNADGNFYSVENTTSCQIDGDCAYLYVNNGVYSHVVAGGTKTQFRRVVKIIPTDGDTPGSWTTTNKEITEIKVMVEVKWNSGTVARDFIAYEFLRKI